MMLSPSVRELELVSAEPAKLLDNLTRQGIRIRSVDVIDPLTVRFQIDDRDYSCVSSICSDSGSTIRTIRRRGLLRKCKPLLSRPILAAGFLLLLLFMIFLPTRVLFISVEGNTSIPAKQILEAAENCGIFFGASRQNVRSEKMKNALLATIPRLQWAGINTYGCTAVISVKEREPTPTQTDSSEMASIVAACDGLVTSCTATGGNPLCKTGQSVKQGEVLISPYLDCSRVICMTSAEGEVYAQTLRKTRVVTPHASVRILKSEIPRNDYYLIIGKKRINLWKDSGIYDATCGRMYKEYSITLPGGFQLPICVGKETWIQREAAPAKISRTQIARGMEAYALSCLDSQTVACRILSKSQTLSENEGLWILDAHYVCNEMIGRVVTEKIGEANEQNN